MNTCQRHFPSDCTCSVPLTDGIPAPAEKMHPSLQGSNYVHSAPMGVSEWRELGKLWGYWDFHRDQILKEAGVEGDAVKENTASCEECRRPYGDEHGFPDLLIPDWAWKAISRHGDGYGLLCPSCICKKLHAAGIKNVPSQFVSGPLTFDVKAWLSLNK